MHRNLRFLLLFSAMVAVTVSGTLIVVVGDYLATLDYHHRVATSMAQVIDVHLRRLTQGAEIALKRTVELASAAGGSAGLHDQEAWRQIRDYLDPVTGGDTIWIVDRDGKVVLDSSSFPGTAASVADRAYFAAGRQDTGVFVGPAIRSRLTDRIVITLTRGLRDAEGRFDGVAGINIDADWLLSFYALLQPEMKAEIAVFRRDGSTVINNRDLMAMIDPAADPVPLWYHGGSMPPAGLLADFDPDAHLVARAEVEGYDLEVVVRLDRGEALARWQVRTRNNAIVAALGGMTLAAVVLLGIRSFERERAALAAAREASAELALARHDALTGLASRGLFLELANAAAAHAAGQGDHVAALYIDLDGFKLVNDRFGHDRGDAVLIEAARVIDGATRSADIAGRIGGDEFVVCLIGPAAAIGRAMQHAAERIQAGVAGIGDGVACSIGMASAAADRVDLPALLRQADEAMREAKAQGKNRIVMATPLAARHRGDEAGKAGDHGPR